VTTPGTFRISDGSAVEFADAKADWSLAARPVLLRVARTYHETISYKDLSEQIQQATGVRTRVLLTNWIGGVLEQVALDCHTRGEPLLSALCVRSDGTVGDGYGHAVVDTYGGHTPEDLDRHSAVERLNCYRHFGAALPEDGGAPALTPQVEARRTRERRQAAVDRPRPICPTCHLELPRTGQCDNCG
jgi:hypothetical protein